jgi:hypothetical protein
VKALRGFPRLGVYPAQDRAQGQALALLEQHTADRFDALQLNQGDVVGDWIPLTGLGAYPSVLGNGRLTGFWRKVGSNNAGFRILLEVGTTTTFTGFGIFINAPDRLAFDPTKMLFPLKVGNAPFPVTLAGVIAGGYAGLTASGIVLTNGTATIVGPAFATLVAGDGVVISLELPTKAA